MFIVWIFIYSLKIKPMRKLAFRFIVVVAAAVTMTSCSSEEGCSDPDGLNYNSEVKEKNDDGSCIYKSDVTNALGDYSYSATFSCTDCADIAGSKATVAQSGDHLTITFEAASDTNFDANTVITGNNITEASNGFTFDVKSGSIKGDQGDMNYKGYDAATLDDVNYNGLFDYDNDEITFGLEIDDNGSPIYAIFTLKK